MRRNKLTPDIRLRIDRRGFETRQVVARRNSQIQRQLICGLELSMQGKNESLEGSGTFIGHSVRLAPHLN
jgi:hypothetical protein